MDFIVGDEAFRHHEGGIITTREGVPLNLGGVAVDPISVMENEIALVAALDHPRVVDGIPLVSIDGLIYMKLKSPRLKDAADVVELLRAGVDPTAVRESLEASAPALVAKFNALVKKAGEEDDSGEV
ncbi:MAG: hypothetical protein HYY16_06170 [Planctomycetes bacterium]|nr:hypothetical protein [Planctomycetota bacterium]